ncbi:MAG: AI-2E family transporter [Chloroflexota bacterium]
MDEEDINGEREPVDSSEETISSSPQWSASTKRIIAVILVTLAFLALFLIRSVIIPVIMSFVLAYILIPAVDMVQKRTNLSRGLSTAIIYLLIVALLIAIPVTTIPQLIEQGNTLIGITPTYIEQLGEALGQPLVIGGITIPLNQLPFESLYEALSNNLISIVQAIGPQGLRFFGATLSTVGWILIVLVLSYYMVKDYRFLWDSIVDLAPDDYHNEIQRLGIEASSIWNAFLRGELILGIIIGIATFIVTLMIGLPNAFFLGLLAGILEFIPNIGPILASIPAVILALTQSESSWLGNIVGPFWFAVIVLLIYGLIQRLENAYLLPRIVGYRLNLHPLVVLIGAIIGASVAGVFGILLAAPLLATARLILSYIYNKLLDRPPFEE